MRDLAIRMKADGVPFGEIWRPLELPRDTVSEWLYGRRALLRSEHPPEHSRCPRCTPTPGIPADIPSYVYLLGLYLGDGHLVTSARVPVLRIFCADAWPGLIGSCTQAMLSTLARKVHHGRKQGCVSVQSWSKHWPCLLPQHGPGKKHERAIQLTHWQQPLVDDNPGHFLRGLIHSDGCRVINHITKGGRTYRYPRYMFSNESMDIMGLCQQSLDKMGVRWSMCRRNLLPVARREAVELLDRHVGAKW